jgi:putative hydrolase of the HAD superfamily
MIKAVIWDVGGVILEDFMVYSFWDNKVGSKQLRQEFGTGKITLKEFIGKGGELFSITEDEFFKRYKEAYYSIKPIDLSLEIYKQMKTPKYILSDTNQVHVGFIRKFYPEVLSLAKKCYLSHEINMRKDSIDVFNYVINDLKLLPCEILFIDDKKPHVDLARKAGMNAIHYKSHEQLKEKLNKLNVK